MAVRILLKYDEDGSYSLIADSLDVEVMTWCPHIPRDEFYAPRIKTITPEELSAILGDKRIGRLGDMPAAENAVADALGIKRPHDLPTGPTLAVDNDGDPA
jgi:hypothetical protein